MCARVMNDQAFFILSVIILSLLLCVPVQALNQITKIHPNDAGEQDLFGHSMAIHNGTLVVGAIGDNSGAYSSGSVYVFQRRGEQFNQIAKFTPPRAVAYGNYGYAVDVYGSVIAVGAPGFDKLGGDSGAVFIYQKGAEGWKLSATLLADDGAAGDNFGGSVSVHSNRILVGAYADDDTAGASGSAYIFKFDAGKWVQETKLHAGDPAMEDYFGSAVDLAAGMAVIGATGVDVQGAESGAAYVFNLAGGKWFQRAKIGPAESVPGAKFGSSVMIHDNQIVVSAPGKSGSGSCYLFGLGETGWELVQEFVPLDGALQDDFGKCMVKSGEFFCVGRPNHDGLAPDSGNAVLFQFYRNRWIPRDLLVPSDPADRDNFGISMAMENQMILVGSLNDDDNGNSSGSIYIYDLNQLPTFTPTPTMTPRPTRTPTPRPTITPTPIPTRTPTRTPRPVRRSDPLLDGPTPTPSPGTNPWGYEF